MTIGILTFLGIFSPKLGLAGAGLAIIMTLGTLSFLVTTPEVWVPDLGSGEHGFPTVERSRTTGDKGYGHTGRRHRGAGRQCQRSIKPNKKDSMMKQYDDIIIGFGKGGKTLAAELARQRA